MDNIDNNANPLDENSGENIETTTPPVDNPGENVDTAQPIDATNIDAAQPIETASAENTPSTDASTAPAPTDVVIGDQPKKKHNNAVLIILIALLVIGGGITAFLLLWPTISGGKTQGNSQRQDEPVPEIANDYRLKDNTLSNFDLKLLQLNNGKKNIIYSPLSIKYVLKMLSDGAAGTTKGQIDSILGDYKPKAYLDSKQRSLANALFVKNDFKNQVLESYINGLKDGYNADVVFDSFSSATTINKWISDKTLGLIDKALEDDEVKDLDYALANALAIKMNWTDRIQCYDSDDSTADGHYNHDYDSEFAHEKYNSGVGCLYGSYSDKIKFNGKEIEALEIGATVNKYDILKEVGEEKIRSTVKAKYAEWAKQENRRSADESTINAFVDNYVKEIGKNNGTVKESTSFSMLNNDDVKVFAKDLEETDGSTLQYVGIMPKNQELADYIKNLKADDINTVISEIKAVKKDDYKDGVVTRIKGSIPLFKYDYKAQLVDNLKELGITDVFESGKANLSNLTTDENSYISKVKHVADIQFSNDGITAAAATVAGGETSALGDFDYLWDVPIEDIDMSFDKPYMYIIRDKGTNEVWFVGAVYEPLKNI